MVVSAAGVARGLRRLFAALLLAGAFAQAAAADPVVATDTRLGEHPDRTRFVIDLDGSVEYRIFTLADPYRIVIDLPEIEWRLPAQRGIDGRGLVKGYRYGLFKPGNTRVVLDLWSPAIVRSHFLLPPDENGRSRLVLDIVPGERETFLAGAGWPDLDAGHAAPSDQPPSGEAPIGQHDSQLVVVLDAGHGGVDPGATGVGGTLEKDVVLEMAIALRDELQEGGRYTVVMTRDDDTFLPLRERVAVARRAKADLFISLHADSGGGPSTVGASVYTLSETASDAEAAALARAENDADIIAGVDLSTEGDDVTSILIDLAQRETKNLSVTFVQMLVPELERQTHLLDGTHRFAGFRVLKAPDVPSVLIELGFLSSQADEDRLNSARWRQKVASGIAGAVETYFKRRGQQASVVP